MTKSSKTTIAVICFILLAHVIQGCSKNCISCESDGHCIGCFHTPFIKEGKCGTDISRYEQSHCMLYYQNSKQCGWCAPGYDLSEHFEDCVQSTHYIDNCRYSVRISGKTSCEVCENSVPNHNSTKCIDDSVKTIKNCLWTKVAGHESYECIRCQEGFSLNLTTKKCEKAKVKGCWKHDDEESSKKQFCLACDPWRGFASMKEGGCIKVDNLFLNHQQQLGQESIRIVL